MASIMVSGQWKLAMRVAAAGIDRERNAKAQEGILERCSDVVPDGTVALTVEEVQFYVSRQIEHDMELARMSDDDKIDGEVDAIGTRLLRDESYAEVYQLMIKAKQGVGALFDSQAVVRMLGPAREVPVDPARLFQVADRCRRWLSAPDLTLGEGLEAFDFDPAAFAARLADPVARLRSALGTLQNEFKDDVDRLKAKQDNLDRLRRLVGMSARFYEALYDLAGMEFESDRIRQSSHRSAQGPPRAPSPDNTDGTTKSESEGTETQQGGENRENATEAANARLPANVVPLQPTSGAGGAAPSAS